MTITITASMLCDLTGGKFTHEACEAICELYESSNRAPAIGDIMCCYGEIPGEAVEDGDSVVVMLENGNALIEH